MNDQVRPSSVSSHFLSGICSADCVDILLPSQMVGKPIQYLGGVDTLDVCNHASSFLALTMCFTVEGFPTAAD